MKDQLDQLVAEFSAKVVEIIRQNAAQLVVEQLTGSATSAVPARSAFHHRKRNQRALSDLGRRFLAFVIENPGLRIEQINRRLGSRTSELALPIRKLIRAGHLVTRGEKRSTTYYSSMKAASGHAPGLASTAPGFPPQPSQP